MKEAITLKKLTNNPIKLLFGLNHFYLKRVFTPVLRGGLSVLIIIMSLYGVSVGNYQSLLFVVLLWAGYFLIDKIRIEKHLQDYNSKFKEALELLKNKQFFKSFKKFLKLGGLKEPMFWIIDNDPQILLGSLSGKIDRDQFEEIMRQIEKKDVDGVVSSFKKIALNLY